MKTGSLIHRQVIDVFELEQIRASAAHIILGALTAIEFPLKNTKAIDVLLDKMASDLGLVLVEEPNRLGGPRRGVLGEARPRRR